MWVLGVLSGGTFFRPVYNCSFCSNRLPTFVEWEWHTQCSRWWKLEMNVRSKPDAFVSRMPFRCLCSIINRKWCSKLWVVLQNIIFRSRGELLCCGFSWSGPRGLDRWGACHKLSSKISQRVKIYITLASRWSAVCFLWKGTTCPTFWRTRILDTEWSRWIIG